MRELIVKTPYKQLTGVGRPDIFIKLESEQFGDSFKARGIINFLSNTGNHKGLITFTTGNQGITVSSIAKALGIKAIIISTPKMTDFKKSRIESLGGEIRMMNFYSLKESIDYGMNLAKELGYTYTPVYGNDYLLEGYSGIADEICDDFKTKLKVFFPVGTGSLTHGNSKRLKEIDSAIKVYAVEPESFQRLSGPSQAGKPSPSMADCLSVDRIPEVNEDLRKYIDGIETVTEEEMSNAVRLIFEQFDKVTEPGAVVTLAAALRTQKDDTTKVAVITGKNISEEDFNAIIKKQKTPSAI